MGTMSIAAASWRRLRSGAKAARLPVMILAWLVYTPVVADAQIVERSPDAITGRDPASGTEFTARADGAAVTVEIGLRGGKRLLARIDRAVGSVLLQSLVAGRDGAETPAPLDQADIRALQALRQALGELPEGAGGEALESLLALLAQAPPGLVLDVNTVAARGGVRSLCDTPRTAGSYTLGTRRVSTRVAVGPCYNEANECLGRCGSGCRSTTVAGFSNPATVQRFTQDCLNHDLCVKRTGDNLGACADEFLAAIDDFLFAPDCASLSGRWTDNLREIWDLEQRADFSVRGTVTLPRCGRLAVRGRHEGPGIALTATRPGGTADCPAEVTYAGRLKSCDVARGTFDAGNNRDGAWRLTRDD